MRCSALFFVMVLTLVPSVASGQSTRKEDKPPDLKRSAQSVDGKTMYEWMKDLNATDPSVRVRAIHALEYYGKDAREAVPHIKKALNAQDTSLRVNATIALGLIGFDAKDVDDGVSALMRLLDSEQHIIRFQAARALGRLGSDAKPAIAKLVNAIKDGHSAEIRGAAA